MNHKEFESALRVPGGNQVDGLPPVLHTEPRRNSRGRRPRKSGTLDVGVKV